MLPALPTPPLPAVAAAASTAQSTAFWRLGGALAWQRRVIDCARAVASLWAWLAGSRQSSAGPRQLSAGPQLASAVPQQASVTGWLGGPAPAAAPAAEPAGTPSGDTQGRSARGARRVPTPAPKGTRRSLLALSLALLLLLPPLLQGCSGASQPPRRVLLDALSLQIRLTQEQVAEALRLEPAGLPEVSRVRVEEQQPIRIGEASGLRLRGRFDWRLADDPIRVDSPFELYLQRGERSQSWRLARPLGAAGTEGQAWLTDPLPLPGERPAVAAGPASG